MFSKILGGNLHITLIFDMQIDISERNELGLPFLVKCGLLAQTFLNLIKIFTEDKMLSCQLADSLENKIKVLCHS